MTPDPVLATDVAHPVAARAAAVLAARMHLGERLLREPRARARGGA